MERFNKEFCLEVSGEWACFTRPELKVERVSYDVITPSAARGIFTAIFWKPAIRWRMKRIDVLNPIRWFSVRRNEVGATISPRGSGLFIEDCRQQKAGMILRDVAYRLYAELEFIPPRERPHVYEELPEAVREREAPRPIAESRDFGIMLYDMDFSDLKNPQPLFFRAKMENGTIMLPDAESEAILR